MICNKELWQLYFNKSIKEEKGGSSQGSSRLGLELKWNKREKKKKKEKEKLKKSEAEAESGLRL